MIKLLKRPWKRWPVKPYRIANPKPLNRPGQIPDSGSNQQMIMVLHQNICVDLQLKPIHHSAHKIQKLLIVLLVPKDLPSLISARQDMIKCIGTINTNRPSHASIIPQLGTLSRIK